MVNGTEEIGVRGSICASDFIVGAGAPGGVRLPWPKADCRKSDVETLTSHRGALRLLLTLRILNSRFMFVFLYWLKLAHGWSVVKKAPGVDWIDP